MANIGVDFKLQSLLQVQTMEPRQHSKSSSSSETIEKSKSKEDEFWSISGKKPFFDVILGKTHVKPNYKMVFPVKMYPLLPSSGHIPTTLKCQGKEWDMTFQAKLRRFDVNWRDFVHDNNLAVGDGCVFELKEFSSTKLVFRVKVLRGKIPPEFTKKNKPGNEPDGELGSAECPIVIL